MRFFRNLVYGVGLGAPLLLPVPVFAHAFGQQYSLPLPLNFFIVAASAAIIASFVILSLFSAPGAMEVQFERTYPPRPRTKWMSRALRTFGVLVLIFAILTGFFGSQDVTKNPALFLFWVALMLAMTYASALVSGLWDRLDPFRTLVGFVIPKNYKPLLRFPKWLRFAPAILFYYWLVWFELLSYGAGASPINVASMLVAYLVIALLGSGLFGTEAWFTWGDFFSVFFTVVGRFAPLSLEESRMRLTWPGERLIEGKAENFTLLLFVLFGLSSTAFDGLHDTAPWVRFFSAHAYLENNYETVMMVLLLLSPFVFFALFSAAVYLMRLIVRTGRFPALLISFAYSLVPIAVVYNIAHYFTLLISEGENFIGQLSDPFGQGLNLFGTAGFIYNPNTLSAVTVWYIQVAAIVLGHIVATYIAHRIALREFKSRWQVVLGQLPMMALMICYTAFGLWILSLPFST